ncbi:IS66 family transposase [Methanobrevibacter gottschalkii]|uniref:IS66 family transposase n=1 Tax=Methanobrevibacter gottschalkii TaxID=190974 RepID=UPI0038D06F7E
MIHKSPTQIQDLIHSRDVLNSAFSTPAGRAHLNSLSKENPGFDKALCSIMALLDQTIENAATNSSNSSLPPSLDPGSARATAEKAVNRERQARANDCEKGNNNQKRRSGGQLGHPGSTLQLIDNPDEIEHAYPPDIPQSLLNQLADGPYDEVVRHQVVKRVSQCKVVEYRYHFIRDPVTGQVYEPVIPEGVRLNRAVYDASTKAGVVEFNVGHMIPYGRTCQILREDGCALSEGSVFNFLHQLAERLRQFSFEEWLTDRLLASDVMHVDETPVTFEKKQAFVHICRADKCAWFFFHRERGHAAHEAMGVLPAYVGIVVHDCFAAYNRYVQCLHALCHAHLERELQGVLDREGYRWATLFLKFFADLKDYVEQHGPLSPDKYRVTAKHFKSLVTRGWNSMDLELPPGQHESKKNSKSVNLLLRLENRMEEWLMWAVNAKVPYTNNDSERPLRMIKVHEKVSNCFRGEQAAQDWCLIRSFIVTCQLHDLTNIRKIVENLFRGILPEFLVTPSPSPA